MRFSDRRAGEVVRFRDSNRDLHMVQAVRGAEFPLVTVRTRLPEDAGSSATVHADLEIQFAGQTAEYKQVPLQLAKNGDNIDPPSLLTFPVKNEIPVRVEMTWHAAKLFRRSRIA